MWICPKCGRKFQRQNQGHYCGNTPANVEEYIVVQDQKYQERLTELVMIIRDIAPGSTEQIKWSMPCFQSDTGSIQFAACKKWISLYIGADVIEKFHDNLEGLSYKKDALYLPYDKSLPVELIKNIIRWRLLGKTNQKAGV